MRSRALILFFRLVSLGFFLAAILVTVLQLVNYSRLREAFPPGLRIAGVPVGGLTNQQANDRINQAYSVPVELRYGDAVIQVRPAQLGFEMNIDAMLTDADQQRIKQSYWPAFWDYLWNRLPEPAEVPLSARVSKDRLRAYLQNEIAARYDIPASAPIPQAGSTSFSGGVPGRTLDIDRAMIAIEDALLSSENRVVRLNFNEVAPPRPAFNNLDVLLRQIIQVSGFDGTIEVYLSDLQTGQEISFALRNNEDLPTGIAFTAASTIKIPVMVSVFRRVNENPIPANIANGLELMIVRSKNEETDKLMQEVLNEFSGPLEVSDDLQTLGLKSTFLAGYFSPGATLLKLFSTPANQRTDINTGPDVYNQTTAIEMGELLQDIYRCAKTGGGTFAVAFPGEISQTECQLMISYLSRNEIGLLFEAGVPEGVQVAHKHGWITESDGYVHTIADAGIIFTNGGDFVLTVYMYHPVQLVFDPAEEL
ncbi:MAG TPA: serine hydrolase, partial [Anaerolineaceae bacterium]|nr:serine hydrolase [Anaerolineaceae bacterium]